MKTRTKIVLAIFGVAPLIFFGCGGGIGPSIPSSEPVSIEFMDGQNNISAESAYYYDFDANVDQDSINESSFYMVETPAAGFSLSLKNLVELKSVAPNNPCLTGIKPSQTQRLEEQVSGAIRGIITLTTAPVAGSAITGCVIGSAEGGVTNLDGSPVESVSNTGYIAATNAPTIVSITDANSTVLDTAGSVGVYPTTFTIVFDSAMTSDASAGSVNTAGNITLVCGALTPTIAVTGANTTFTVTVTDSSPLYALRNCNLTIRDTITSANDIALAANMVYPITTACAVNDTFDVDSQSCWDLVATSTFGDWATFLASGLVAFDTTNGILAYDDTAQTAASTETIRKTVASHSDEMDFVIHFKLAQGFNTGGSMNNIDEAVNASIGSTDGSSVMYFGIANASMIIARCHVTYYYLGAPIEAAYIGCNDTNEHYIRFGISSGAFVMQHSNDNVTYTDLVPAGAGFPSVADFLTRLDADGNNGSLNLHFNDTNNTPWHTAEIDDITATGITVTGQY